MGFNSGFKGLVQSVVHGVRNRLFCGHKGSNLLEVSINLLNFVETKRSLPCSQQSATYSYPESKESSPHPVISRL